MSGLASSKAWTIAHVAGSAVFTSGFCIDSVMVVLLPPFSASLALLHAARARADDTVSTAPATVRRRRLAKLRPNMTFPNGSVMDERVTITEIIETFARIVSPKLRGADHPVKHSAETAQTEGKT